MDLKPSDLLEKLEAAITQVFQKNPSEEEIRNLAMEVDIFILIVEQMRNSQQSNK